MFFTRCRTFCIFSVSHKTSNNGEHYVRATGTTRPKARPKAWPSVAKLRELCDEAIKAKGYPNRTEGLRRVNMSAASLDRVLKDGLIEDARPSLVRKLGELGVLEIVPRQ
jgi:hypothetical protein